MNWFLRAASAVWAAALPVAAFATTRPSDATWGIGYGFALFVYAIDEQSRIALVGAALAAALAALAAYQAIFLAPILAVYLFEKQRGRVLAWCVVRIPDSTDRKPVGSSSR